MLNELSDDMLASINLFLEDQGREGMLEIIAAVKKDNPKVFGLEELTSATPARDSFHGAPVRPLPLKLPPPFIRLEAERADELSHQKFPFAPVQESERGECAAKRPRERTNAWKPGCGCCTVCMVIFTDCLFGSQTTDCDLCNKTSKRSYLCYHIVLG